MAGGNQTVFNLVFNALCSFWAGALVVAFALFALRIEDGRWKQFLLSLPLVKIFWDLVVRGLPGSSILFSTVDPLALPPKHQTLVVGSGWSPFGPQLEVALSARALDGRAYSTSLADYFFFALRHSGGTHAPEILLASVLLVSCGLLARRAGSWWAFERQRRRTRGQGRGLVSPKGVDIYLSPTHRGTPFTGGLWRPYVCLPATTWRALDRGERAAVLHHELAHVRNRDLWATLAIGIVGDLFWFIPGYRILSARLAGLREILADRAAVRRGASGAHLASALLKLAGTERGPAGHPALIGGRALLRTRIEYLLAPSDGQRKCWIRGPLAVATALAVFAATFGGNHAL